MLIPNFPGTCLADQTHLAVYPPEGQQATSNSLQDANAPSCDNESTTENATLMHGHEDFISCTESEDIDSGNRNVYYMNVIEL